MIAICIPTRGLVHSRTIEAILKYAKNYQLYLTHDKPIPDCFNDLTQRALADGHDVIWFIEEDIVIQEDTQYKMMEALKDHDVVAHNYVINKNNDVIQNKDGRWTFGTGCTMIKRKILDGYTWTAENHYEAKTFKRIHVPEKARSRMYGMHDIEFCYYCYENDIPVKRFMDRVGHIKLKELGQRGRNDGYHIIVPAEKL